MPLLRTTFRSVIRPLLTPFIRSLRTQLGPPLGLISGRRGDALSSRSLRKSRRMSFLTLPATTVTPLPSILRTLPHEVLDALLWALMEAAECFGMKPAAPALTPAYSVPPVRPNITSRR